MTLLRYYMTAWLYLNDSIPWLSGIPLTFWDARMHRKLSQQITQSVPIQGGFAEPCQKCHEPAKSWMKHFTYRVPNENPFTHAVVWGSRIQRRGFVTYLRIQCKSGVRIKIYGSGFKNPDPYLFALHSFWFEAWRVLIRTCFRVSFSSFDKNSLDGFDCLTNSAFFVSFWTFSNGMVSGLMDVMQIRTCPPFPQYCKNLQTRYGIQTTDPALKLDPHFVPSQFASWISYF